VQILVGQDNSPTSVASGGVAFTPLTAGVTEISADIPGLIALAGAIDTVTVTTPTITLTNRTVGAGLQRSSTASLGAPAPGGTNLVIKSSAPGIALVSPNNSTPGTDSIVIALNANQTSQSYYIQGVEGTTGAVTFTASSAGYTDGTAVKTIVQPAVAISSLSTTQTVGATDDAFWAQVGTPNATQTGFNQFQGVSAGATDLTITFMTSDAAIGQLVTTAGPSNPVILMLGSPLDNTPTTVASGGVAFDGLAQGTAVVTVDISGYILLTTATVTVTVNP
jgi:hypothetical protein